MDTVKRLISGIILTLALDTEANLAMAANFEEAPITKPLSLEYMKSTGESLRAAIEVQYEELSKRNAIRTMGTGNNDISSTVKKFIVPGMSFDDALIILQIAGFVLKPRGENVIFRGHYGVEGAIANFKPQTLGEISLYVWVEAQSNSNWKTVSHVRAEILKQII